MPVASIIAERVFEARDSLRRRLAWLLARRLRKIPVHVAIIPDGNRRWARRRRLKPWHGHAAGYLRVRRALDFLWDLGVRVVTLYAMSYENCLSRPREEKRLLYALILKAVDDILADKRVAKGLVRVKPAGELSLLPGPVQKRLYYLREATASNKPYTLNVGVCYGGEWEIVEAYREALGSGIGIRGYEDLRRLMVFGDSPRPDLVIRAGGEKRISNFLLPHIAYSELYFSDTLWPDFDELELVKALLDYQSRERRYGR